jgi:hypothetical protein
MMKKLLSFMLVFCIAGIASASSVTLVPILPNDPGGIENPLHPSETILVYATSDTGLIGLNATLTLSGPGHIVGASGIPHAAALGWDPTLSFDPKPSVQYPGGLEIGMGTFGLPAIGQVAWWEIHCNGPDPVIVTLNADTGYGGSMDQNYQVPQIGGSVTIYQTPEPMTVALLGLGGLFLRRRK